MKLTYNLKIKLYSVAMELLFAGGSANIEEAAINTLRTLIAEYDAQKSAQV